MIRKLRKILREAREVDVQKAFEMRKAGHTDRQIATHFGFTAAKAITQRLEAQTDHPSYHPQNASPHGGKREGAGRNNQDGTKITAEQLADLKRHGADPHLDPEELAKRTGLSVSQVYTAAAGGHIPPRIRPKKRKIREETGLKKMAENKKHLREIVELKQLLEFTIKDGKPYMPPNEPTPGSREHFIHHATGAFKAWRAPGGPNEKHGYHAGEMVKHYPWTKAHPEDAFPDEDSIAGHEEKYFGQVYDRYAKK